MDTREIERHDDPSHDQQEDGVEIPIERINPETLRNLISEFVTREWEEIGDSHYTLEDKIAQVVQQLQENKVKVVFDLTTNTANLVVNSRGKASSHV